MPNLSHILSPTSRASNNADTSTATLPGDISCPRALIGRIPASAPLHLAIAHQLGNERCKEYGNDAEQGSDDLTVPIGVVRQKEKDRVDGARNTLIIASERSRWHEALVEENDSWIRDYGAVPEVSDALQRIEIKYCSSPKDALILLTLLHPALAEEQPSTEGEDASTIMRGVPDVVIAWDLFGLFLESEDGEQSGADEGEGTNDEGKEELEDSRIRSDSSVQEYLSLMAMLRQAMEQITSPENQSNPQLIVLEPQITSNTELPLPKPQAEAAVFGAGGKQERRLKVIRGLEWILAPGYREVDQGHTILEIAEVKESDGQEAPPGLMTARQFGVRALSCDTVATFEQTPEDHASGKPWLDRIATMYRWL